MVVDLLSGGFYKRFLLSAEHIYLVGHNSDLA